MTNQLLPEAGAREPIAATRAIWSGLDAAATPAFTLATLAAVVRALSATDYGVLVIALAASGLSMAVNPAIAASTTRFVSELSGQQELNGRSVAGVITVSLLTVASIDLILLLGTAVFNDSLCQWLFGPTLAGTRHMGRVLMLAVLSMAIQQIEAVLAAAIKGLERFKRQAIVEMLSRATLTGVIVYIAWSTKTIEAILIAQCAGYFTSMLVRAVVLRQLVPDQRLFRRSAYLEIHRLLRYSGWMWLTALAGIAYNSADRIIIGRILGVAAAGEYNIYVQITQLIHFVPSSVFAFLLPAFSRLAGQVPNRSGEIARTYRVCLIVVSGAAIAIAILITFTWPLILRTFVGSRFNWNDVGTVRLLILNFLLLACVVVPYYLMLALGYAKVVSTISSTSMFVALTLMIILIPRYGLEGAAFSRLPYGVGTLLLLLTARRVVRQA